MGNAIYAGLTRQSGLMREMQVIANNIANMTTTGFRREGTVFAEHVVALDQAPSLSMARASARVIDLGQGEMMATGGRFDFAIAGPGFFMLATPDGDRLTRAGHFTPNADDVLVSDDGFALLDAGGAPVAVPPGAQDYTLATDGTLSADDLPVAQIGLWEPADPLELHHVAGTLFAADAVEPLVEVTTVRQGFLEGANVNPMIEIARMVAVQRAYELGQDLLDREDQRIRNVMQIIGR